MTGQVKTKRPSPASPDSAAPSPTSRQVARPKRLGSEVPRIFTPPLRELTPETSLGFAAITFAEEVCGITLFPWQQWLLIHALELREDGSFRFRNVIVLVARQNGKSTLSQVLSLFALYVLQISLVLGTAQDLDTAEEVWEGAQEIIEETPELAELALQPIRNNGKKAIRLVTGERYKVKAANRRAGRGLSGDLIILDELREHQSWDAWGAITKTTIARPNAQVWALSNAGDATSVVLRHLRKKAHAELGDPDGINAEEELADEEEGLELDELLEDELPDDSLGIFEWSAAPGRETRDRDGWCEANPSLGYTITERTIASALATDPEPVFRTEVLCQWIDGSLEGPFPPGTWEATREKGSAIGPDSDLCFCLDVSVDRGRSHIGVAGYREDGIPHIEVIATRAGVEWVVPWLTDRVGPGLRKDGSAKPYPDGINVVVQLRGAPASSLIPDLQKIPGVTVCEWEGANLGRATAQIFDLVKQEDGNGLRHLPQPILDIAAASAAIKLLADGALAWDRKRSPTDAAPLVAVTGALWGLRSFKKAAPSVYETEDLVVL